MTVSEAAALYIGAKAVFMHPAAGPDTFHVMNSIYSIVNSVPGVWTEVQRWVKLGESIEAFAKGICK